LVDEQWFVSVKFDLSDSNYHGRTGQSLECHFSRNAKDVAIVKEVKKVICEASSSTACKVVSTEKKDKHQEMNRDFCYQENGSIELVKVTVNDATEGPNFLWKLDVTIFVKTIFVKTLNPELIMEFDFFSKMITPEIILDRLKTMIHDTDLNVPIALQDGEKLWNKSKIASLQTNFPTGDFPDLELWTTSWIPSYELGSILEKTVEIPNYAFSTFILLNKTITIKIDGKAVRKACTRTEYQSLTVGNIVNIGMANTKLKLNIPVSRPFSREATKIAEKCGCFDTILQRRGGIVDLERVIAIDVNGKKKYYTETVYKSLTMKKLDSEAKKYRRADVEPKIWDGDSLVTKIWGDFDKIVKDGGVVKLEPAITIKVDGAKARKYELLDGHRYTESQYTKLVQSKALSGKKFQCLDGSKSYFTTPSIDENSTEIDNNNVTFANIWQNKKGTLHLKPMITIKVGGAQETSYTKKEYEDAQKASECEKEIIVSQYENAEEKCKFDYIWTHKNGTLELKSAVTYKFKHQTFAPTAASDFQSGGFEEGDSIDLSVNAKFEELKTAVEENRTFSFDDRLPKAGEYTFYCKGEKDAVKKIGLLANRDFKTCVDEHIILVDEKVTIYIRTGIIDTTLKLENVKGPQNIQSILDKVKTMIHDIRGVLRTKEDEKECYKKTPQWASLRKKIQEG